jgi:hypothetical protein
VRSLGFDELRALWRRTFRSSPPSAFTKDLVARFICWHLQEQALGGLDANCAKLLDGLARGDKGATDRPRRLKPGTVLVREYQGERHTVTVVPDGFLWRDSTYKSLTTIARAITGTAWSGPRFFGVQPNLGLRDPGEEPVTTRPRLRRDGPGIRSSRDSEKLGGAGLLGQLHHVALKSNARETSWSDADRERSCVSITAPHRHRGASRDFFDQSVPQELPDHLAGCAALQVSGKDNGAVLPPRGSRQQHELGISECHGIILVRLATASRAVTTEAPQQGLQPAGQIPGAPRALYKAPTVTLCLQRKSSTLYKKIWLCRLPSPL